MISSTNFFKRQSKSRLSKRKAGEIAPEEILLDASNLPNFDTDQFEGRFERPIKPSTITITACLFLIASLFLAGRFFDLEIVRGAGYAKESAQNTLRQTPIFADRGVIYDRNGTELAWNEPFSPSADYSERTYINEPGLSDLLGFVSYPKEDSSGNYYDNAIVGKDGVEKSENQILSGEDGEEIVEVSASGTTTSSSTISPKVDGQNITLSIDASLTEELYKEIAAAAADDGATGGAGVMMDVRTGEILAMTSYPEYSSNLMSNDVDNPAVGNYFISPGEPFLNRAVSGLYAPGSIVKPYEAVGALEEGIVDPNATIDDTGSISIPNPYFPGQVSVFKDWSALGIEDMYKAIAFSSDVYFYELGGGYQGKPGLGIGGIDAYAELFGFGSPTGINLPGEVSGTVPSPAWKADNFNGEPWYLGDTYHSAIGQYGWQVTPIQVARAMAAIGNDGNLLTPTILTNQPIQSQKLAVSTNSFNVVHQGMREGVTVGISKVLDLPQVAVASKTGTAQVGFNNQYDNSWDTGFFPYDDPHYAFVVVLEHAPAPVTEGGLYVMQNVLEWMVQNTPQYLK